MYHFYLNNSSQSSVTYWNVSTSSSSSTNYYCNGSMCNTSYSAWIYQYTDETNATYSKYISFADIYFFQVFALRPVINLKQDLKYSGNGTKDNPYVIS